MTRPSIQAAVALVTGAFILAACGPTTPSKPELTDPREIIAAAAAEAAAAPGVHIDASLDGSLTIDLLGLGGGGAPVDLSGSTAAVDLAIASGDARVTFALASVLRGELRTVGGVSYLKTTIGGARYEILDGGPVIGPNAIPDALEAILTALDAPGLTPVKGDDVPCGSATCYRVTLSLRLDDLADLGTGLAAALPPSLADAAIDLAIDVTRDTNDLATLEAVISQADGSTLTLVASFSKWDQTVTVEPPPADEIAPPGG